MFTSLFLVIPVGAALLAAGGASALGSIVSGIFGSKSQSSTNKVNYEIAKKTNQMNQQMNREQLAYNRWALEEQNLYNSAPEQVARLKAAGLNPSLFMGTGAAGTSGTAQSYNPIPAQGATMENEGAPMAEAINNVGQSVMSTAFNMIDADQNQQKIDADTANAWADLDMKRIDLQTRADMNIANLRKLRGEAKSAEERAEIDASIKRIQQQTEGTQVKMYEEQYNQQVAEVKKAQTEANIFAINEQIQQKNLDWLDTEKAAELGKTLADIQLSYSQGNLNYAQANLATQQAIKTQAEKEGVDINNRILRKSANGIIREANWKGTKARYEAIEQSWNAKGAKDANWTPLLNYNGASGQTLGALNYLRRGLTSGIFGRR